MANSVGDGGRDSADKYDKYIAWKRELLDKIALLKKLTHISKARVCCGVCRNRLFDACFITPTMVLGNLRKVDLATTFLLKKFDKDSRPPELCEADAATVEAIDRANVQLTSFFLCQLNHLVAVGLRLDNAPERMFVPATVPLEILFPDNSVQPFDCRAFEPAEGEAKEKHALFFRNKCLGEFVCHICDLYEPFRNFEDANKHLATKYHIENEEDFRKLI